MQQQADYTGPSIPNSLCDDGALFFDTNNASWMDMRLGQCYSKMTGPAAVMWDVTNRCNLSCLHCYNQSGARPNVHDLGTDEMLGIAKQILEVKPFVVCLCGGEPLLREDLPQIISFIAPHLLSVNMVSNGYILDEDTAKILVDAGVGSVQISLDGAVAETHDRFRARQGSWKRAVRAIKALVAAELSPPVTFIPNKLNYREIAAWGELCIELGAHSLRLMPLIPLGRTRQHTEELQLDSEEEFIVRRSIRQFKLDHPGIMVEWGDPLNHIYNFANADNPMRTFAVEIRPDGKLLVSSYLPLVAGDLKKHTLKEYWDGGLKRVWSHPKVLAWTKSLRCLEDFSLQQQQPWNNEDVQIDLMGSG